MFKVSFTEEEIQELREALSEMSEPVDIYTFIDDGCQYCENTVELINVIADASPEKEGRKLLNHIVVSKKQNPELFQKFNIERVPTVALMEGYIRYTGMPAGEEVRGLVETIIRLSQGDSGLSKTTVEKLAALKGNVHIEVIVTPTCPYCPYAALLANMMAFEAFRAGSKAVVADTVEAYENPDIADGYGVMSVPTIALNKKVEFIGLPYEAQFLEKIIEHSETVFRRNKEKERLMDLLKELE
ncbi:MAG: thioredoxin family protein [Desulfurococcales archaeon]|nr:thioredoxin family protein [Desulfurococcales archaeon]